MRHRLRHWVYPILRRLPDDVVHRVGRENTSANVSNTKHLWQTSSSTTDISHRRDNLRPVCVQSLSQRRLRAITWWIPVPMCVWISWNQLRNRYLWIWSVYEWWSMRTIKEERIPMPMCLRIYRSQLWTDFCGSDPCMNGGVCFTNNDNYLCQCVSGFIGHNCEKDICAPDPCMNGGSCLIPRDIHDDTFSCVINFLCLSKFRIIIYFVE